MLPLKRDRIRARLTPVRRGSARTRPQWQRIAECFPLPTQGRLRGREHLDVLWEALAWVARGQVSRDFGAGQPGMVRQTMPALPVLQAGARRVGGEDRGFENPGPVLLPMSW